MLYGVIGLSAGLIVAALLLLCMEVRAVAVEMRKTQHQLKLIWKDMPVTIGVNPGAGREHIPVSLRKRIIEKCQRRCSYCGKEGTDRRGPDGRHWHIDHVVPVASGGPTHESNLTLACATCNGQKGKLEAHALRPSPSWVPAPPSSFLELPGSNRTYASEASRLPEDKRE